MSRCSVIRLVFTVGMVCSLIRSAASQQTPLGDPAKGSSILQAEKKQALTFVDAVTRENLKSVVGLAVSSDGKFFYAAAYGSAAINVFQRDLATGALTLTEEIVDRNNLSGVTDVKLTV